MNKNILVSAGVALLVVILSFAFFGPSKETVREIAKKNLGATSNIAETSSETLGLAGVYLHTRKPGVVSATTTPITARSPVHATSTLLLGSGCYFSSASSTAKTAVFAKSANQNSTTTALFQSGSISANAAASIVATTTNNDFVFAPGNYLSVSLVGGSGTDSPTADCSFIFLEL